MSKIELSRVIDDYFKKKYYMINEHSIECLALLAQDPQREYASFLDNIMFEKLISDDVKMLITTKEIYDALSDSHKDGRGFCIVDDPRLFFFELHNCLSSNEDYTRKSKKTVIQESSKISKNAVIADNNVYIGHNVIIEEFCSIKENTVIKDNVIIRAGTVVGSEGFEFKRSSDGIIPVKHLGGVVIDENVEIQSNCTIDKAIYPWDDTVILEHSKIDNLVHVAHGVKIGRRVMIVANSGIGGRVFIDDDAWIGFNATLRNGIKVGRKARTNMGAIVTKDVDAENSVTGNFAIDHEQFIKKLKGE